MRGKKKTNRKRRTKSKASALVRIAASGTNRDVAAQKRAPKRSTGHAEPGLRKSEKNPKKAGKIAKRGHGETAHGISERKKTEESLRESEKRLRTLLDAIPDAVFFKDSGGRHIIANRATEELFGLSPEMMVGKTAEDLLPPEIAAVCHKNDEEVLKTRRTVRYKENLIDKNGNRQIVHTIKVPLYDENDNSMGLVVISRDITEREKAASDLELFKNLLNKSREAIFVNDAETGRFIDVNDRACSSLGYDRAELLRMGVRDIEANFPDDLKWQDHVAKVKRQGFLLLEGINRRKDGTTFPVETNVSCVVLGAKEYMIAVVRDISERKLSEAALRTREKQLAESQRIAHIGSWEHNLTTGEVVWSDELFRLLGLDPRKDPGDFKMFFGMIHPDDQPAMKKGIDETVKTGKHFSIDYRFILRDGTTRILHAQAELRHDESGKQIILSGTGQDITERKQAEEKIKQSEEFIRNILNTVDEGFIVIDKEYRILTANKAYCSQVLLPCDAVIGKYCYAISHNAKRPCYEEGEECAVRHVFETGTAHTAVHRHVAHEGHVLYVETKGFPIKNAAGEVTSVIETINNITEKHLLEEERLKTQKLESIGTLAGGIAHDFNNLLQGVFGFISLAKRTYDRREKSLAMLEQAERALHQSVNLTTQLLTFSKGGKPVRKPIAIAPVIENAVKFALSGSQTGYRLAIDSNLRQVNGDAGQLGQVIQNIVLNADQAMPLGGSIAISARNAFAADARLPPTLETGDYVEVRIEDTGAGIPEQYLDKIFDPYFTTKEKGSGLGLATSYSIVRNHNGKIYAESEVGKGTVFTLYLPTAAAVKEPAAAEPRPRPPADDRLRVLVMDDEEIIRRLAAELLCELGHDVDVARHGDEALEKYRAAASEGRCFDAVILDLTIRGGMGGAQTLQRLREIDPEVKAIVSSGYSDDDVMTSFRQQGFSTFLKKPYDLEGLRSALSAAVA
jgi:PAS domain S-box-containing protein